ncbi:MAG: TlpA family protein disulfide reductase [Verrucomicrobia bacterium]|nr:TlpA family protein disulfide reductase [Deltaproteobacteria bacterium]
MKKNGMIPLLALLLLMFTLSPAWSAEPGESLPDFTVRTFDGKSLSRTSFAGKPLLLVFWNTWCSDCMRELPEINRLVARFAPGRLAVLAINTALNDSESKARAYWKKSAYLFPSGFDQSFELGQLFRVRGVPTVFLVDSRGIVRYKQSQFPRDMEERIKQLL